MKVNILGTDYNISKKTNDEEPYIKKNNVDGYCDAIAKEIVILDFYTSDDYKEYSNEWKMKLYKEVLRHELIHAFFNESGLRSSANIFGAAWSKNEEMIDWIALQFPKIFKAFQEAKCI